MSRIDLDVEALMPVHKPLSLIDGLIVGGLIGAAGATLVIVGQMMAARRIARRYPPPGTSRAAGARFVGQYPSPVNPPQGSPLGEASPL